MALNFVVSYTFSPSTTISSSQVNTNTSDVAAVFQGLEAETKTLAKLKVDIDPTLALEVATKQYVDHYAAYRRPVLQYSSATVVNIETGINNSAGVATILFPDGNLRTDSTSGRINCNLAQVAALSGSAQSGLQTGTVAVNTWYAIYAVKVSDNSSNFVTVATLQMPVQSSLSTLNSNFGTNSWVYLGMVRNGDNSGSTGVILNFKQTGNVTKFAQITTGTSLDSSGIRLATTASATTLTYTYAAGTGAAQIPTHITMVFYTGVTGTGTAGTAQLEAGPGTTSFFLGAQTNGWGATMLRPSSDGAKFQAAGASSIDIYLEGFIDPVLGVGSNPFL